MVFWLYRWSTLARWGRGVGGRLTKIRLRDYTGGHPGWTRLTVRATSESLVMGTLFLVAHLFSSSRAIFSSSRAIGLMAAALTIMFLVLNPHDGRNLTDLLTGTQHEPTTVQSRHRPDSDQETET